MAAVSLSYLRQRARELAGQETGAPTSALVDDTELGKLINEALAAYHGLFVEIERHEWVLTQPKAWSTTLVLEQVNYTLPYDLLSVMDVRCQNGSDVYRVPSWEWTQRADLETVATLPYIDGYYYRVVGQQIQILPEPRAGYTLLVDYVPEFAFLLGANDVVHIPSGWEIWPALHAAIKMVLKTKTDASELRAQFLDADKMVRSLGGRRGSRGLHIVDRRNRNVPGPTVPRLWRDS